MQDAQHNERFSYTCSFHRDASSDDAWMLKADQLAGLTVNQMQSHPITHDPADAAHEEVEAAAAAAAAEAANAASASAAALAQKETEVQNQKLRLQASMARSLARLDKLFAAADSDGNGSFDRIEFRGLVAMLGLRASEVACDALFGEMDADGSGSISFTEFLVGQLRAYLARASRRLMDVFLEFDVDRSRTVDRTEFVNGVAALGLKVRRQHIEALFDSIDDDRSGKLEFKELHAALKQGNRGVELRAKNRVSIRELRERKVQRRTDGITTPLPSPRALPQPAAESIAQHPPHRHRPPRSMTAAPQHRAPPPPPPTAPPRARLGPGVVSFADFRRSGRERSRSASTIAGGTATGAAPSALGGDQQYNHMSKLLRTELDRLVFRGA